MPIIYNFKITYKAFIIIISIIIIIPTLKDDNLYVAKYLFSVWT